ncbi:hypothetical protein [Paenibacillus sp. GCM10012306]|uniref:hypothetical protein n=1 Tax=Paenibacillus sp. GCM10012306 TaxID=3317342 RepID=UPI0036085D13
MAKKQCLFCDQIVPLETSGDYDKFIDCHCAPGDSYRLLRGSYETVNALSHQDKRQLFPILSAYIREQIDRGNQVVLAAGELESIANSPDIPATIEEKGARFLQYLYRHSEAAGEAVVIQPLANSYNITYSPNLQELVYIIDKLAGEELLVREGMSFKLTDKGWAEAAARAGGRRLKPCCVLLSADPVLLEEWSTHVLPRIEQCGYSPQVFNAAEQDRRETYALDTIAASKLIIADVTTHSPEVYLGAGYALGQDIPVLWTMKSVHHEHGPLLPSEIRLLLWDTAEELAAILLQRLSR